MKTEAVEILSIGEEAEEHSTHLPPYGAANYGTLCGVSTDDGEFSGTSVLSHIDCKTCFEIWRHVTQLKVTQASFTKKARSAT